MARVPNTESTLLKFTTICSSTTRMRPRLDSQLHATFARAANPGSFALTTSAPAKGSSIGKNSDRAISAGSTETPGSKTGNTSGDTLP